MLFIALAIMCRGASAQQEFEGWNLEPGVGQAHLVMVARVVSISRATVVQGAKTDVVLREYRFQPVRVLKGLFKRDQLSMTAADLGLSAEAISTAAPLSEGEFRLLILAQQRGLESFGCVSAAPGATTFGQRVPRLSGPEDPLVAAVETLIEVADSRSRRQRASLLIGRLATTDGVAAVPLLTSLRFRADWAATDVRAYARVAHFARNPSSAIRGAAVHVLRDMLASRIRPEDLKQLDDVADSLRSILASDEANTQVRLAALQGLGYLLAVKSDFDWARDLLTTQLRAAATHSERAAAATALSQIVRPQTAAAVLDSLEALPIDESSERETIYAWAAIRLDSKRAEQVLLSRLKRSIAARQSLEAEVNALGRMRSVESIPLMLTATQQSGTSDEDRRRIAWAFGELKDDRGVPVLVHWLRGNNQQLKGIALTSMETLDSQVAAQELRPLLKTEGNLSFKLRIARLLARHGIADGYALATEHLADDEYMAAAALVLGALRDPRTTNDLSAIMAGRADRRWQAAAMTGLAAIDDPATRKQLTTILEDDRHRLVADAALAVALTTESELLLPLTKLAQSRNKHIARNSILALRRFLVGVRTSPRGLAAVEVIAAEDKEPLAPSAEIPLEIHSALVESIASLVVDAYVEPDIRHEALVVLTLLRGERYPEFLAELADQAELEGTSVLERVQHERRRAEMVVQVP